MDLTHISRNGRLPTRIAAKRRLTGAAARLGRTIEA